MKNIDKLEKFRISFKELAKLQKEQQSRMPSLTLEEKKAQVLMFTRGTFENGKNKKEELYKNKNYEKDNNSSVNTDK